MSLKPINDLAIEFSKELAERIDKNLERGMPGADAVQVAVITMVAQYLASRDAEHAALAVTTDAYSEGYMKGYEACEIDHKLAEP